jgi:hypothetical protein
MATEHGPFIVDLPIENLVIFHSYVSVFCMFTRGYHIHKNFESASNPPSFQALEPSMLTYSSVISSCEKGHDLGCGNGHGKAQCTTIQYLYQHLSTVWGMFKQTNARHERS